MSHSLIAVVFAVVRMIASHNLVHVVLNDELPDIIAEGNPVGFGLLQQLVDPNVNVELLGRDHCFGGIVDALKLFLEVDFPPMMSKKRCSGITEHVRSSGNVRRYHPEVVHDIASTERRRLCNGNLTWIKDSPKSEKLGTQTCLVKSIVPLMLKRRVDP